MPLVIGRFNDATYVEGSAPYSHRHVTQRTTVRDYQDLLSDDGACLSTDVGVDLSNDQAALPPFVLPRSSARCSRVSAPRGKQIIDRNGVTTPGKPKASEAAILTSAT